MLVPLLGYVTLIKEELSPESPAVSYTKKIEHSARKTEGLLDTILRSVRPQQFFHPAPGDLSEVLQEAIREWQTNLPPTAQISTEAHLVPCPLVFDRALMKMLIQQVLSNARYAMALGGVLKISLKARTLSRQGALELKGEPNAYELVLSDTGFGMSPQVLRRACEPFFTTRPRGHALGLGLTAVHSIVRLHGGQLLMESREDVGTTLTISLPIQENFCGQPDAPAVTQHKTSLARHDSRILFVDEDPLVRDAVKTYLQRLPVEVTVARDGAEGLKMLQKGTRQFNLIVSDIPVPKMTELEFYESIRKLDPDVPMVWMCGDPEAAKEDALATYGPKRPLLIRKPFGLRALTEAIRKHLS